NPAAGLAQGIAEAEEDLVDFALGGVPVIVGELRTVEETAVVAAGAIGQRRFEMLDAHPDIEQAADPLFDELQRRHHVGDTLAGEVLEIADLEDAHNALLDVLSETEFMSGLERGGQRVRRLVDL